MHYRRLTDFIEILNNPGGCVDLREYRKAQLVLKLLFKHFGDFTLKDYELFMEKADVLEASIYERLIVEAARDGIRRDPALFQGETFREMKKHLSNLPIFSASYK